MSSAATSGPRRRGSLSSQRRTTSTRSSPFHSSLLGSDSETSQADTGRAHALGCALALFLHALGWRQGARSLETSSALIAHSLDFYQDLFRYAFLALRKRWAVPGRHVASAGWLNDDDLDTKRFCGTTMVQSDLSGSPMFVHANLLKRILG